MSYGQQPTKEQTLNEWQMVQIVEMLEYSKR